MYDEGAEPSRFGERDVLAPLTICMFIIQHSPSDARIKVKDEVKRWNILEQVYNVRLSVIRLVFSYRRPRNNEYSNNAAFCGIRMDVQRDCRSSGNSVYYARHCDTEKTVVCSQETAGGDESQRRPARGVLNRLTQTGEEGILITESASILFAIERFGTGGGGNETVIRNVCSWCFVVGRHLRLQEQARGSASTSTQARGSGAPGRRFLFGENCRDDEFRGLYFAVAREERDKNLGRHT